MIAAHHREIEIWGEDLLPVLPVLREALIDSDRASALKAEGRTEEDFFVPLI
jgi:hypothetical protein